MFETKIDFLIENIEFIRDEDHPFEELFCGIKVIPNAWSGENIPSNYRSYQDEDLDAGECSLERLFNIRDILEENQWEELKARKIATKVLNMMKKHLHSIGFYDFFTRYYEPNLRNDEIKITLEDDEEYDFIVSFGIESKDFLIEDWFGDEGDIEVTGTFKGLFSKLTP